MPERCIGNLVATVAWPKFGRRLPGRGGSCRQSAAQPRPISQKLEASVTREEHRPRPAPARRRRAPVAETGPAGEQQGRQDQQVAAPGQGAPPITAATAASQSRRQRPAPGTANRCHRPRSNSSKADPPASSPRCPTRVGASPMARLAETAAQPRPAAQPAHADGHGDQRASVGPRSRRMRSISRAKRRAPAMHLAHRQHDHAADQRQQVVDAAKGQQRADQRQGLRLGRLKQQDDRRTRTRRGCPGHG